MIDARLDGFDEDAADVRDRQADCWPRVYPVAAVRGKGMARAGVPANAFLFLGDDPFLFLDGSYFGFF